MRLMNSVIETTLSRSMNKCGKPTEIRRTCSCLEAVSQVWGKNGALLGLLFVSVLSGCAADYKAHLTNQDLMTIATDTTLPDRHRLTVLDQLQAGQLNDEEEKELGGYLSRCLLSNKHSSVMRRRIAEIIITDYREAGAIWLATALPLTPEVEIRQTILRHLEFSKDKRVIVWLVMDLDNLSRQNKTMATPTLHVLQTLADQGLAKELCSLFADLDTLIKLGMNSTKVRLMILRVLSRLSSQEKFNEYFSSLPRTDPLVVELDFWEKEYHYQPLQMAQLLHCRWLRLNYSESMMATLKANVRDLSVREDYRFHCSDSHLLLNIDPEMLLLTTEVVRASIVQHLNGLHHQKRIAAHSGAADDYAEYFSGRDGDLSYTDLLRISLYLNKLKEKETVLKLKKTMQDDFKIEDTEVGGVVRLQEETIHFKSLPPGEKAGDRKYILGLDAIRQSYDSLAIWHCHADQDEHHPAAGPGKDDLDFVRNLQQSMVVVSHVKMNSINVDYVSKDCMVVDLGVY